MFTKGSSERDDRHRRPARLQHRAGQAKVGDEQDAGVGGGQEAGDAREDQHRLAGILMRQFEELLPLLLGQVHLEGHFVLSVVEHLQQAPGPDGENIYYVQEV